MSGRMNQQVVLAETAPDRRNQWSIMTTGAMFLSVFLLAGGGAIHTSVVALRAEIEGFAPFVIGLTMSAFFLGYLLGTTVAPPLLRSVGYTRTFAGFATIGSAAALGHLLVIEPIPWLILRVIHGLCTAAMLVVVESWMNRSTPRGMCGRVFTLYSLVYLGSMGAGQPLLGVFGVERFEIFVVVSIIISMSLIPVTLSKIDEAPPSPTARMSLPQVVSATPFASAGIFVSGVLTGVLSSLGALYAYKAGLDYTQVGLFMAAISAGAIISQFPVGLLSDRFDRRTIVVALSGVGILSSATLFAGSAFEPNVLLTVAVLVGASTMPMYSLCLAHAHDAFAPDEMVKAAGAFVTLYAAGSMVGPAVSGTLMEMAGHEGIIITLVLTQLLFVAYAGRKMERLSLRSSAGSAHRFHPYPRTTAAAFGLLRRTTRNEGRRTKFVYRNAEAEVTLVDNATSDSDTVSRQVPGTDRDFHHNRRRGA